MSRFLLAAFGLMAAPFTLCTGTAEAKIQLPSISQRVSSINQHSSNVGRKICAYNDNAVRKSPIESTVKPISEEPILDTPKGKISNWSRQCGGYLVLDDIVFATRDNGGAVQIVEGDDNTVYLSHPTSTVLIPGWLKGTKDENGKITIPGGQAVYSEVTEEGVTESVYVVAMQYVETEDGGYHYPTADGEYSFVLSDGQYVSANPDIALGLCYWENGEMIWSGYGDDYIVLSEVKTPANSVPDNLDFSAWVLRPSELWGWSVDVAIDGDDIYIKGLAENMPDHTAVGKIKGDMVTFPEGQLLGFNDLQHWAFLYGGYEDEVWDDYDEEYVYIQLPEGDLTMQYDSANKHFRAENSVLLSCVDCTDNYSNAATFYYAENPTITFETRDPYAKPLNPDGLFVEPYDDYFENGAIYFSIPIFDVDGCLLDVSNLYYYVYFDDELYTFYPDEYPLFKEPVTLMPCNYNDYGWIVSSGPFKAVYYFMDGVSSFGIQSVYYQKMEDGSTLELKSDIVKCDIITDGIEKVETANDGISSSVYFDISGRVVNNPSKGIYIRMDKYADGVSKTYKQIIR